MMNMWLHLSMPVGIKSFSITRLKHLRSLCGKEIRVIKVGIKSFSITRLKQKGVAGSSISELSWNQKFLDYEIETQLTPLQTLSKICVGIKSFSITRLKLKTILTII